MFLKDMRLRMDREHDRNGGLEMGFIFGNLFAEGDVKVQEDMDGLFLEGVVVLDLAEVGNFYINGCLLYTSDAADE